MIGTTVARYKIVSKLGGGGMGVVYEAEDAELGRRVAIKFLPEGTATSAEALERFKREARAASALDHPHICTVFDAGTHEGRPFLVMERLRGQTLNQLLGAGALPVDQVISLGEQIADALDVAHRAGIVHRDLKPANLFVTERGAAKVLDFGLAKLDATSATNASDLPTATGDFLTEIGRTLGTVAYMSPEQARGKVVDARSDLFSLGVVLYEMATGRLPFEGDNTAERYAAILKTAPAPPSQWNAEIPEKLEQVILKSLEKDPDLRFQSAADLHADLLRLKRDASAGALSAARSPSHSGGKPSAMGRGFDRLSRAARVGIGIGVVILLAGLGYRLFGSRASEARKASAAAAPPESASAAVTERSIAVLPFRDLSEKGDQAFLSEGIAEDLLTRLAKVRELKVIARGSSFSFKGKDTRPGEIARALGVVHLLDGSVRRMGDAIRVSAMLIDARSETPVWSETYDRKLDDVFAVQDEIARAVVAQLKLTLLGEAKDIDARAYGLFLQAREVFRQGTKESYEQTIDLIEQGSAQEPDYAPGQVLLAGVYIQQAASGLVALPEGIRLARETIDKALAIDPQNAQAYSALGWIEMNFTGDLEAAARHMQRALELYPGNVGVLSNAAILAVSLGRLDLAIAAQEHALTLDPLNISVHFNLGGLLSLAGRYDEAIESLQAADRLAPGRISGQYTIGNALVMKGDFESAIMAFRKEPDETFRLVGLAIAHHALGQASESDAALAELIREHGSDHAFNIACVLAYRNEIDRAFEWLDKAQQFEDPGVSDIAYDRLLENLHRDPRWLPLLRKLGKAPEQLDKIQFDIQLPKAAGG